jgi:4-amino-4-deoxy-L-arabinose transferase-like glycosyltransferase
VRRKALRVPMPLALILLIGALLSVAWDLAVPAFQGPDEDAHFGYVQHLAETGRPPSPSTGSSSYSTQEATLLKDLNLLPLRGNLSARPAWSSADLALWHQAERQLPPGSSSNGNGPNATGQNPPLYYALMAIPYWLFSGLPLLKLLFVMRLFDALCFLATIALTWLIAGEVFGPVRWKQTMAAGAVALQPQLAFMSVVINSDGLLTALTTALLLMALRMAIRGPTLGRVLAASGITAAAVLTHGRGLVTVPVLGLAILVAWLRHRPSLRDALAQAGAAAVTVGVAFVAYLLFAASGGSGGLYGGEVTSINTSRGFNFKQFLSSIYQFYFPRLPSLTPRIGPDYGYRQVFINTFYATFGQLEVTFRQGIYDILQVASALGLVAFYTACVVRWRALRRSWPAVAVMLSLLLTLLLALHYISYRELLANGGVDPVIVGRYLLPMVSLFGLAIAFTVGSLPRRIGPLVGAAILSAGLLLALGGIGITAARFYA